MVLEGVVVDLVNRFLGDFIENLDKSQLSIGIWGGKQRPMPLTHRLCFLFHPSEVNSEDFQVQQRGQL